MHEIAHAHGIDYQTYSRPEAELIVESVAYIVCLGSGLDTGSDSIPYLAGWNGEQALDRIAQLAGRIDEIARAIEHALEPDPTPAPAATGDARRGVGGQPAGPSRRR